MTPKDKTPVPERPLFAALTVVAVLLALAGCAFFLLIPTQSLAVHTVYQGF